MTVAECQSKMTLREYNAWIYRINKEIEQKDKDRAVPSLTDWYLMQINAELRSAIYSYDGIKKPITLNDFILSDSTEEVDQEEEEIVKFAETNWVQRYNLASSDNSLKTPDFEKWQQQLMK